MHLAVKHCQPIPAIQHLTRNTHPGQITDHIGLHTLQPGLCLGYAVSRQSKGDILGAHNAVVAFGNLIFQHIHELAPDAVVVILLCRDIHLVAADRPGTAVDKGKLERQRAVEIVEVLYGKSR